MQWYRVPILYTGIYNFIFVRCTVRIWQIESLRVSFIAMKNVRHWGPNIAITNFPQEITFFILDQVRKGEEAMFKKERTGMFILILKRNESHC